MINVSMASWLQDVQGFMSRVRRRNRLMAVAADDRQKMIMDTIFRLLLKIFNLRARNNRRLDALHFTPLFHHFSSWYLYSAPPRSGGPARNQDRF